MAARKLLVIDAPIFIMVNADADPEGVASDFDDGFQTSLSGFEGVGDYEAEIIDAGVREIRSATKEEIDARGIEIEGDIDDE
jgi:hypothetical protein